MLISTIVLIGSGYHSSPPWPPAGRTASVPVPPLSPLPQFPHLNSVWWQWGRGDPILSLCHISDPAPNPAPTAAQPGWLFPAARRCTVQWSRLAPGVVPYTTGGSGWDPAAPLLDGAQ